MPSSTPNPNKFRITANNQDYTIPYDNAGGTGIDLYAPTSLIASYTRVTVSSYTVLDTDFILICDTSSVGSNIDLDLAPLSSTTKHGKILAIKKLADGGTFPINMVGVTIDGNTPASSLLNDYSGIVITYDKINNQWYIISNI